MAFENDEATEKIRIIKSSPMQGSPDYQKRKGLMVEKKTYNGEPCVIKYGKNRMITLDGVEKNTLRHEVTFWNWYQNMLKLYPNDSRIIKLQTFLSPPIGVMLPHKPTDLQPQVTPISSANNSEMDMIVAILFEDLEKKRFSKISRYFRFRLTRILRACCKSCFVFTRLS